MTAQEPLAAGHAALAAGRWGEARTAFEAALAQDETARDETAQEESAQACFGLAAALWWLGDNQASVSRCTQAYSLFRRTGEVGSAVQCGRAMRGVVEHHLQGELRQFRRGQRVDRARRAAAGAARDRAAARVGPG